MNKDYPSESPPLDKICVNCKHSRLGLFSRYTLMCHRNAKEVKDLVSGISRTVNVNTCELERMNPFIAIRWTTCGKKGRYFEPKN